ncbi:MAG: gamma-glutamyltransferase, partial [Alphaproteobacteria bacterium]|nr:gamma-glutamyltransferase [Alphaproteobacteria bacterium]
IRRPDALPGDDISAGDPPWKKADLRIDGFSFEMPSTSHFTIVDNAGNIASMTTSIENAFGSRQMAAGFLLNNQLTDFSFRPQSNGANVANRVEPGKRPRSSMSPTIVLKDGKPVFALGSPGGSAIIPYVATTIIALIDWNMDMQQAISLPHLANRFGRYDIEAGTAAEALAPELEALGYEVSIRDMNSGLHGVAITADGL